MSEQEVRAAPGPRSYNNVLFKRGIQALESQGLDMDKAVSRGIAVQISGLLRQSLTKGRKYLPKMMGSGDIKPYSIDRGMLGRLVLEAASEVSSVSIRYDMKLESVDFGSNTATFTNKQGDESIAVEYDLLIGADGANSVVRSTMEQQIPDFKVFTVDDDKDYKILYIPKITDMKGCSDAPEEHWESCFHTLQGGEYDVIGPPCYDGALRAACVAPSEGPGSFAEQHTTVEKTQTWLKDTFGVLYGEKGPTLEQAKAVMDLRPNRLKNVYCSALTGKGNVVLVGDAAHAMTAALGQGVNAALEDVSVLTQTVDAAAGASAGAGAGAAPVTGLKLTAQSVPDLVAQYNAARLPDAHAVCKLSEGAFGGGRTARTGFILQMLFIVTLSKLKLGRPPALTGINDPSISYNALLARKNQESIKARACVLTCLTAVLTKIVRAPPAACVTALLVASLWSLVREWQSLGQFGPPRSWLRESST